MILTKSGPETEAGASAGAGAAQQHSERVHGVDFAQLIEGEAAFLRRAARRWHREPADAEDLVQDTIVQALANAHQWQPGTDLRGWLYTIMRNRFYAGVTRSNRSTSALEQIARADFRPATEACELRLVLRDLLAALRRLPSNQRSAVLLIGVEGKSYGEAAETMGTSVGAVRSHLARGRERLRTAVQGSDTRTPFGSRAADGSPVPPRGKPPRPEAAD
ncbi:MAG: sigma-70 family RNA polymerase sigma factor [Alphaproteobacteria bacterium]|nr:sigma-70 family RNA polymerase sigma factor [Alphaproteobacteria bacterium]